MLLEGEGGCSRWGSGTSPPFQLLTLLTCLFDAAVKISIKFSQKTYTSIAHTNPFFCARQVHGNHKTVIKLR